MASLKTITQFKSRLAGGGARPNLFEVNINDFKYADAWDNETFQFLCKTAALPQSSITPVEIPFRGRVLKVAGDRTFDTWTVTVINDTSFNIRDAMEQWSNAINDLQFDGGETSPAAYQKEAFVTQLGRKNDNKGTLSNGGDDMQQIRQYKFFGIYPNAVSSIPLDYGATDQIEEFQVTFNYIYWTVTSGPKITSG